MRKLTQEEISRKRLSLEDVKSAARLPLIVIAENVRSLYNVGSIFRTSDGALVQELVLTGYTPTPPRKEIEKTALGATNSVPWRYVPDPIEELQRLRSLGYRLASLEHTTHSVPYFEVTKDHFPMCLVIGNEVTGVSKRVLSACDMSLEIPMYGHKHSLNVAVAYGVAVFELSKRWRAPSNH